jgi:HSP20 family molecular chaperone IbpA
LPATVQPENVRALLKDGVLELTLPKAEDSKPRRIAVDVR